MKKLIILLVLVIITAAVIFYFARPVPDIMSDPRIDKYAKIQAEIEIEAEKLGEDTMTLGAIKDSIYHHYGVDQHWIDQVTAEIDRNPQSWVEVYDLMIEHAEYIKDSLLYKTRPQNDST
jgi:hypothetical protein